MKTDFFFSFSTLIRMFKGIPSLVGGFNPLEKYQSNWIISPGRDENEKSLKTPPSLCSVSGEGKPQRSFRSNWLNLWEVWAVKVAVDFFDSNEPRSNPLADIPLNPDWFIGMPYIGI